MFYGTVSLGGVGGAQVESPHGAYQISLPLRNGRIAVMGSLVIVEITEKFPTYTLNTDFERDIRNAYKKSVFDPKNLPRLPESLGGRADVMIGIKYLRYFPKEVFQLPSGLTLYSSPFMNVDGSYGVVGGSHELFTAMNKEFYSHYQFTSFITNQALLC